MEYQSLLGLGFDFRDPQLTWCDIFCSRQLTLCSSHTFVSGSPCAPSHVFAWAERDKQSGSISFLCATLNYINPNLQRNKFKYKRKEEMLAPLYKMNEVAQKQNRTKQNKTLDKNTRNSPGKVLLDRVKIRARALQPSIAPLMTPFYRTFPHVSGGRIH